MCIAALAMWVPALVCLVAEQHYQSRTFFYSGLLGLTFVTIMGITLSSRKSQGGGLSLLIDLGLAVLNDLAGQNKQNGIENVAMFQ